MLALEQTDFKKHKDVIAYFNQHYVNTEIFPKSIGRKIAQAQRIREDSDYDDEYRPSYEKTEQQINTAKELITLVEEYIENKVNNSNDSFHSATNMKRLKKAIKDVEEGKITIHELVEDEDE